MRALSSARAVQTRPAPGDRGRRDRPPVPPLGPAARSRRGRSSVTAVGVIRIDDVRLVRTITKAEARRARASRRRRRWCGRCGRTATCTGSRCTSKAPTRGSSCARRSPPATTWPSCRRAVERLPWGFEYLRAIRDNPEVRAEELAASFGVEKRVFKPRVRRLKELGLTISLSPGYRLSPRGEAFLKHEGPGTTPGPSQAVAAGLHHPAHVGHPAAAAAAVLLGRPRRRSPRW